MISNRPITADGAHSRECPATVKTLLTEHAEGLIILCDPPAQGESTIRVYTKFRDPEGVLAHYLVELLTRLQNVHGPVSGSGFAAETGT